MKKLLLIPFIFLGCANTQISQNLKNINQSNKIIEKYQVNKDSLTKVGDFYAFFKPSAKGIQITLIDKNLNIIKQVNSPILMNGRKLKYIDGKLYLLGYDENNNEPVMIIFSKNLKVEKIEHFPYKYAIAEDFTIINKKPFILINTFSPKTQADILVYNKQKIIKIATPKAETGKFIKKYLNGYIITGSVQNDDEDLLVANIQNNKIQWIKTINLGMGESPQKLTIKNKNIIIDVISQDFMGAATYYKLTLDKNGKIISKKKNLEFKALPTNFRT